MTTTTASISKKTSSKKPSLILTAQAKRKTGEALVIYVKAHPLLEELFKKAHQATGGGPTLVSQRWTDAEEAGLSCYSLLSTLAITRDVTLMSFGDKLLEEDGKVNVSILRSEGISKGITFKPSPTDLITLSDVMLFLKELGKTAKELWANYISPIEVEVKVKKGKINLSQHD